MPSFWRRNLRMTPAFEAVVLKDHLPSFRSHWIESKRHDGFALKEAMVMLYESELLVGALLLGTFTSMMFSGAIAQPQLDDFREKSELWASLPWQSAHSAALSASCTCSHRT